MKTISHFFLLLIFLGTFLSVRGQEDKTPAFTEIDEVITTLYNVISGPPGERDWALFRSLFHEHGTMGAVHVSKEGERDFRYFTTQTYIDRNGPFFTKNGFFEEELGREIRHYGGVAQVFTAYQFRLREDGEVAQKGINCIQLVYDANRWFITNIVWEAESPENPIPARMLSKN
ncbi:hypothetical protein [Ascidiimonas aurantiaca]|uniref:hypothetical protein n=1 Tax=Ascidiimonas aurantiaca TaxID=1685432 RepID=UPI0030EF7CB5